LNITVDVLKPEPSSAHQPGLTGKWGITDAVIVGAVGYAASVLLLLLSMFETYSLPAFHSLLEFHQLDSGIYVLAGLIGGIAFGGALVTFYVHKRKLGGLPQSIDWECSNRVLAWACVAGFVAGIGYSLAKAALAGRGYQHASFEAIAAFVVLAGLAQPAIEEIYSRGILFVALARRFGNTPSIAAVTILFCVAHPQHWFTVLPIAVLLGGVRLYARSVKACFACHAAYNLSLILFMLPIIRN
jgi:membrane protease YdiL (CAAX protease family)